MTYFNLSSFSDTLDWYSDIEEDFMNTPAEPSLARWL